ncbi:MAG: hypothetical protein ACLQNE_26710 [Thermoguttaceae bacterium]
MNARKMLLVGALVAISLAVSNVAVAKSRSSHPIRASHSIHVSHPIHVSRPIHVSHPIIVSHPHPVIHPVVVSHPRVVVCPNVVVRPPVVVRPVVVANPPVCVPASVRIVNPATTGVALSYTLNGQPFGLQPGTMEQVGTASVIQFDRGNGLGIARYTLDGGTYTFTAGSNGGWDLVRALG